MDSGVEAFSWNAPDKFGFGAGRRRRSVEDAGRLKCRKTDAATVTLKKSADADLQIVNGRTGRRS